MYSVDIYNRVRRACLKDEMSVREAALYSNENVRRSQRCCVIHGHLGSAVQKRHVATRLMIIPGVSTQYYGRIRP